MKEPLAGKPLVIRADADSRMGTGHVMRCLALAQAWQDAGGQGIFLMAAVPPALQTRLESEDMEVAPLQATPGSPEDAGETAQVARSCGADWVVVDGYHFGADYQRLLKNSGLRLLCIDDYGHAAHYSADLVLNQNINAAAEMYANREAHTRLLLGTRYVLLRREFWPWRGWRREIPEVARKVLVTLGGGDPDNVTLKVIQALAQVQIEGLEAVVVVGAANPHLPELDAAVTNSPHRIRLEPNVTDMAKLMAWADVIIIAMGGTLWESFFMGNAIITYLRNAVHGTIANGKKIKGSIKNQGDIHSLRIDDLCKSIENVALSTDIRQFIQINGNKIVDGFGTQRVIDYLTNNICLEFNQSATLELIYPVEKTDFQEIAIRHFTELNEYFVKYPDWEANYFERIYNNTNMYLYWIYLDSERIGFIIFGVEDHRFLPRKIGIIYELYIITPYRRKGIATKIAFRVFKRLYELGVDRIQLEVVPGNDNAMKLWQKIGFIKVAVRFVLNK